MFLTIILLVLIVWLFFSKIGFEIKNVKNETKILITFGVLIKIKLNYEKFMKRFDFVKSTKDINMKVINEYINNIFISRKLYNDLCKNVVVNKFALYKVVNIKDKTLDAFSNTLFLISASYIKTYLNTNFKKIKKEKYLIVRDDNSNNEYDFHIVINIMVIRLLFVLIKNAKVLYKIIKIKRSNYGTSNSHIT